MINLFSLIQDCYCGGRIHPKSIANQIRGGKDTLESIPWQVALVSTVGLFDGKPFCSGALISEEFVLTAAHCLMVVHDKPFTDLLCLMLNQLNEVKVVRTKAGVGYHGLRVRSYPLTCPPCQ
jgi:secreted trypsin-like serine protease